MYITDKNKSIKNRNVNHKKPTPSAYLLQRFFKTVKRLGIV